MSNNVQQFPQDYSDSSSTRAGETLPSDSRLTLEAVIELAQQISKATDDAEVKRMAGEIIVEVGGLLDQVIEREATIYAWASGQ